MCSIANESPSRRAGRSAREDVFTQTFNARDILHHLWTRGFLSPAAVVAGDVALTDIPRRNRNFKVVVRRGASYFVKQAVDPSSRTSVAREAEFYRFLSSRRASGGLQRYLVKYCGYDSGAHLLVLELKLGSRELWEHYECTNRMSMLLARRLGSALAALHKLIALDWARALFCPNFTADPPWVLSVYQPNIAVLGRISAANLKLVRTIQQYAGFAESLKRLSLEWRTDRLIHFDIKSDNLVTVRGPSGRWTQLTLVDWELVGLGDACWDIGSVFADYLGHWLSSMRQTEGNASERVLELSGRQLVKMQRALRVFWEEYLERLPLRQDVDHWLIRSVEYSAARLLQRCYEQLQLSVDLTPTSIRFLQVSQNMMQRPAEAAVRLLGLPLQVAAL